MASSVSSVAASSTAASDIAVIVEPHFDVILGHVDRFETDQKALTPAPAGTAAPTGPATALVSPGTSQTELIRVFYAVLYPDFTSYTYYYYYTMLNTGI